MDPITVNANDLLYSEAHLLPTRRLGRQPTTDQQRSMRVNFRAIAPGLEPAPPSSDWSGTITRDNWLVLANDQLGDCGPASMYHAIMSWSIMHKNPITPADSDVIKFYTLAGGYHPGRPWTDGGVNNPTMLAAAQKTGMILSGTYHQIGPTATVAASDIEAIKQGMFFLGGALFGIELSNTCYTSKAGDVWDADNSRIIGGHDVWGVGYNEKGPLIVSWGTLHQCTWAWAAKYADDIDLCVSPKDWAAGGTLPCGINLSAWQQACQALTGQASEVQDGQMAGRLRDLPDIAQDAYDNIGMAALVPLLQNANVTAGALAEALKSGQTQTVSGILADIKTVTGNAAKWSTLLDGWLSALEPKKVAKIMAALKCGFDVSED